MLDRKLRGFQVIITTVGYGMLPDPEEEHSRHSYCGSFLGNVDLLQSVGLIGVWIVQYLEAKGTVFPRGKQGCIEVD